MAEICNPSSRIHPDAIGNKVGNRSFRAEKLVPLADDPLSAAMDGRERKKKEALAGYIRSQ
jgi:hypothetical protein